MDENVLPDMIPDSPLKQQESSRKKSSNGKLAVGQRSPLKDIANHTSEAKTVKKDIKEPDPSPQFDAVYRLHEKEGRHEDTEIVTHTDRTAHHKFSYKVDEDIRVSSDVAIPALAMDKLHYRDVAKLHVVTGVNLGDSESEYESAEDVEETEKPFIQNIASPSTPIVNSTLLQATSSANCSPADRSSEVFENSLLNSFENMKIAETDEPTLEENFHDASDIMENVTLSPHSKEVPEDKRSAEIDITEQPTALSVKESENPPNENEYSCAVSPDKKNSSHYSLSITERTIDMESMRKETPEKKAMSCSGMEGSDELVKDVNPDQKCYQMKSPNKPDDTNFDTFAKKQNKGNSPNKMDIMSIPEVETFCEMRVIAEDFEATGVVLQKEGILPEKKYNIMEKEDTFLEKNDLVLESKHTVSEDNVTVLVNECNALEIKDMNSKEEDTCLEIEETVSEKGGPYLQKEFSTSEKEQTSLERKETSTKREDVSPMLEMLSLGKEDNPLQRQHTFENGGIEAKDEGISPYNGNKVNSLNLEDLTSNPLTSESFFVNSPSKKESAFNVQSETEEEICGSSALILPKRIDTTDDSSAKDSIPQQNAVDSCVENMDRENVIPVNKESQTGVVLEKNEMSEKVAEEPVVDEISHPQKTDINFATAPITVNPPDGNECKVMNEKEMHCKKLDMGTVLEKMETPVLEEMVELDDTSSQNGKGAHESNAEIGLIKDAEKGNCYSQNENQMDSQIDLDDTFTSQSVIENSPGKEAQSLKPEKEVDIQLISEKKETSQKIKESVKDDSVPNECIQKDFFDKLDDPNFDPFTTKVIIQNSPVKEENAFIKQIETKKETSSDDFVSKVMLKLDEGITQESNVSDSTFDALSTKSTIVNSPNKEDFAVVDKNKQSQKAKTDGMPKMKQEKQVICEKETCSSQMDFLSQLDDTNFDPFKTKAVVPNSPVREENILNKQNETEKKISHDDFTSKVMLEKSIEGETPVSQDALFTKSTIVNSPNKEEFPVIEKEKSQSQKAKTGITPKMKQGKQVIHKKETHSSHMDILSKLDDPNFDPFRTKVVVQNSPAKEENVLNKQKETSPDDFTSNVMVKSDEGKIPVPQSDVRDSSSDTLSTKSAFVNSPNKEELTVVERKNMQSQKAKTGITPKMKQKKQVIYKKETHSSQKEVIEEAVKDGLTPQKYSKMDFSKLDDLNFDPFATKSSVVNSPEKQDIPVVNEEEKQSQKVETSKIPEKKQETQLVCKEKDVFEIDDAPLQKCSQIDNLDDPTFDPFKTKAAVQNSPVRKEDKFDTRIKAEEKINHEESSIKGMVEEKNIKKLEKVVTESDQSKGPVFQEDYKTDCHKKVDQNIILKSEEVKKVMSVVTPLTCQKVEQNQASTKDPFDVFSPLRKGQTRTQGNTGAFNFEEEFTNASDFFNTPEDLDVLGTHGTQGDKLNLVRNSLYVKFDPLVSGRQSLAPYLAQQIKESELDPRRCSGLISFSPSPIKHQRDSDNTGTPVRALLSTRADETVLDATDLDNTTVTEGGNTTFVSCNQTFNNTVICGNTPDSANETMIHQSVVSAEKMVTEREMNDKLKNLELIMQDNELRKCREYEEVQKNLKQQVMENGIALSGLEEENSALRSSVQQMQDTLTKILQQDAVKKKEHRNQLQLLENKYELKCSALQKECQQYHDELKKSEVPFFDLVKKYERLREVLESLRKNEESLKSENEMMKAKMAEKDENFKTVVQTYEDQLQMAESEKCTIKQNQEQELKKASVMLKKAEVKILSLTEMVEKLNTEKGRLTDLLEEITNNMGATLM